MRFTVAALLCFASLARADAPAPAPLRCLEKYYGARAVEKDGAWSIEFGGRSIAWDDQKRKTFDEQLEHPDVKDAFSIEYEKGAIKPVTEVNHDPGRIRLDPLIGFAYPESGIVKVELFGRKLNVHKKVADAFKRVEKRLQPIASDRAIAPFLRDLGGTFVKRNIAGTDRPSAHSYGISIDLNTAFSHYWRWQRPANPIKWQNKVPQAIVDAFEAEGFIWGGRWYHFDTMHFEYRPELLDESCYAPTR